MKRRVLDALGRDWSCRILPSVHDAAGRTISRVVSDAWFSTGQGLVLHFEDGSLLMLATEGFEGGGIEVVTSLPSAASDQHVIAVLSDEDFAETVRLHALHQAQRDADTVRLREEKDRAEYERLRQKFEPQASDQRASMEKR